MTCPRCGKPTPKDSFCSVACMKLYSGKQIDEEQILKERYELLDELTEDFTICPFCNIKLRISKPKKIENDKDIYERNKYCPKCYRIFGHLYGNNQDDIWEFKKIPFEEARQTLYDLQEILKSKTVES
ncbi:MAG: hypothetical protein ACTSRP_25840 [Candidatus Helarchaeota archaeon]